MLFSEISNKCDIDKHTDETCKYIPDEWSEEDLHSQAVGFVNLLDVCLNASNCDAYQFWGFTDKYSWLDPGMKGLPWDTEMQEKNAAGEMINALQDFERNSASV